MSSRILSAATHSLAYSSVSEIWGFFGFFNTTFSNSKPTFGKVLKNVSPALSIWKSQVMNRSA